MVHRKGKPRGKKPRCKRKSLEAPTLLRRAVLYGAALLLVWVALTYYRSLRLAATAVDLPYDRLAVYEGSLQRGELRKGLTKSGSDAAEAKSILQSLRRIGAVTQVRKGDAYRLVRSTDGTFRHLTIIRGRKQIVVTRAGDKFTAAQTNVTLRDFTRIAQGEIHGSLWLSMAGQKAPAEIIQEYADVFQWTVDFLTEPRDGDRYAVTWVERRSPDGRVWKRDIQAAVYDGKKTGRHVGVLFQGRYFDEKGLSMRSMFLRAPLNFRRISSYFSRRRYHPVLRRYRHHRGIDYAANRGTPVVSVGAGKVTRVGRHGGYGKRIVIRHSSVYSTLYGHLNGYAKGIRAGKKVRQGQLIGYVGSTGLATGPHLHFEIKKNGKLVNFLRLKLPKTKAVPVKNRKLFSAARDRWLTPLTEAPSGLSGKGR